MLASFLTLAVTACSSSPNDVAPNTSANNAVARNVNNINQNPQNADDIIKQYEQEESQNTTETALTSSEPTTETRNASTSQKEETVFQPVDENAQIDVDLCAVSKTMLLSELYSIFSNPSDYLGKTISIPGKFTSYESDETGKTYYYLYVMDEGGCCPVSLEFISKAADQYPSEGDPIKVTGVLKEYSETYDDIEYPFYYVEVA